MTFFKRILACAIALVSVSSIAATLSPIQLLNPAGSTSGQAIVSTGASSAPAWSNVSASSLAAQAANTVVANVTGSSASPAAFVMPSCSTSTSALQYTLGTGWTCYTNSASTSNTLAQFAATTSAQLAGVISDETGTGALVFANSSAINPTSTGATTPGTGAFTTLAANSTITPSQTAGIVGTTTNNNANVGSVGEYPTPGTCTTTSLTSAVAANCTSLSLTAGDWDVSAVAVFNPAGTTIVNVQAVGISTTSATFSSIGTYSSYVWNSQAGTGSTVPSPTVRVSIASTTTVYMVVQGTFTTSTCTVSGFLRARRVR
ncbi:hypothetical protein PQR12_31040 [Paraburkholderia nemoris]|uniref:hypothetical protein n=1 Tax=Paraburkholderia nemoris TaxID=2793076 RepID=UPI0038BA9900